MIRTLAGTLSVSLLLAGCAGIPVQMDPASMGRAYVEIQHDVDGTKSTCHVKAAGGMEAKGIAINARLCGKDGERIDGKADDLSGKEVQLDALDKWASLSAQQQQTTLALAEDALKVGGPLACAAILTAVGFPAATPFCAALAGVTVPDAPPVVTPSAFASRSVPLLERGRHVGPGGHVRYLEAVDGRSACWRGETGTEHCGTVADWLAWAATG